MELQTFDVLLFEGVDWWPSRALEIICDSPICHVAIALKNPTYLGEDLVGEYIIESGEENTPGQETGGKLRWGVQIQRASDAVAKYPGKVSVRRFEWIENTSSYKNNCEEALKALWEQTKDASYDLNVIDLIEARFGISLRECQSKEFVCSAYATFLLMAIGALPSNINWDTFAPFDFVSGGRIDKKMKDHGVARYVDKK